PRPPQPVPPIYQPEVAARGIHWAALHRRRELYVGFPAVKAIIGNKLVPGLADRKLARSAYQGQMDQHEAMPDDRPDNLEQAVQRDYGTHGRFDSRARSYSVQLWLTTHRGIVAAAAGAMALATACGVMRHRHRR
ncbi:MAG TPA: hypothetical protein VFK31_03775, partial [Rhodanobacteraceae bacterium]|nr:hypothetical protein [Rhodanobacteraceae bacterium]